MSRGSAAGLRRRAGRAIRSPGVRAFTTGLGRCLRAATGLVLVAAAPLAAQQVRSSLVVSGLRIRYADAIDVTAMTLAPTVTRIGERSVLGASGSLSQPSVGPWSAQGQLDGSYFTTGAGPLGGELSAVAGGSRTEDGVGSGQLRAVARAHVAGSRVGAWAGAGVGTASDGLTSRGTRLTEVGAWAQGASFGVVATLAPTVAADTVRFTDAQLSLRWRGTRAEFDGALGWRSSRRGLAAAEDPDSWASASASLRVTRRLAVVASGGTYPLDPLQGLPAGRFASIGLRLTGPGSGPTDEFARETREVARDRLVRDGIGTLAVRRRGDGRYELRVRVAGADRVELTGDLTAWTPVPMRPQADGWWTLAVDAAPGTYELTVRRDGRAWVVPPGLTERRDEFGGVSGLVSLR